MQRGLSIVPACPGVQKKNGLAVPEASVLLLESELSGNKPHFFQSCFRDKESNMSKTNSRKLVQSAAFKAAALRQSLAIARSCQATERQAERRGWAICTCDGIGLRWTSAGRRAACSCVRYAGYSGPGRLPYALAGRLTVP